MRRAESDINRLPWVTAMVAVAGVALAVTPRAGEFLQYERTAVESGAYWRLLSGQLVHWTPRMAAVDLLVLLITGAWLEIRSRPLVLWTSATAALLVGLTVHAWTPGLALYRGSSGIASGLYVAVALVVFTSRTRRWIRGLALAALLGFCMKTVWETATGSTVFAGELSAGVSVVPAVHLAGALAGILCVTAALRRDHRAFRRLTPGGRDSPESKACDRPRGAWYTLEDFDVAAGSACYTLIRTRWTTELVARTRVT